MWRQIGQIGMSIRSLFAALMLLICSQVVMANGTLTHLSGKVSVLKADGSSVQANVGDTVLAGDTVITEQAGFVRLEMTDGGEMLIRPDSQLKIEDYKYDKDKPQEDSFVFKLVKGGFRTVTGLISKRGNRDAYKVRTATATIGIRGTQYDVRECAANCGALPDGTYVSVRFGSIEAQNEQGNALFGAGQVGFVSFNQAPVQLPHDPGIGFKAPVDFPKLDEKKKQEQQSQAGNKGSGKTGDEDGSSCSIQ
jgi:hypothetical protein